MEKKKKANLLKRKTPFFFTLKSLSNKRQLFFSSLALIDFDDFSSPFTPQFLFRSRRVYQILETVSHRLSNHLEFR